MAKQLFQENEAFLSIDIGSQGITALVTRPFDGTVEKVDITAKTNVFLDGNFMKRHRGERERFQEY